MGGTVPVRCNEMFGCVKENFSVKPVVTVTDWFASSRDTKKGKAGISIVKDSGRGSTTFADALILIL